MDTYTHSVCTVQWAMNVDAKIPIIFRTNPVSNNAIALPFK